MCRFFTVCLAKVQIIFLSFSPAHELPFSNLNPPSGLDLHYNVYEFKVHSGRYKAELITPADQAVKEIIFWKVKET